jgi:hypothetical protein
MLQKKNEIHRIHPLGIRREFHSECANWLDRIDANEGDNGRGTWFLTITT